MTSSIASATLYTDGDKTAAVSAAFRFGGIRLLTGEPAKLPGKAGPPLSIGVPTVLGPPAIIAIGSNPAGPASNIAETNPGLGLIEGLAIPLAVEVVGDMIG